ncbi:alpha/beta hydrolase [Leeuwenhoekiella sp. W20_SRS_FM14]|uniref:alpha/beta hydrolase n=1 Tax=Leeuwenhoekiella sp. W20_SRS_FM14 TaxID=3240270 RepID=UPI003F95E9AE
MKSIRLAASLVVAVFVTSCSSVKHTDINYLKSEYSASTEEPTLNIFQPKDSTQQHVVLIFVHGGNWNSGSKNTYSVLGRNFAKNDYVTVIPGYTLSPFANYDTMTQQITEAILWTKENIANYGGNPDRIFLMGHSAGGHLIALATMNPKYLNDDSLVKGLIFDDAAALDQFKYLQENSPTSEDYYDVTWTKDPEEWRNASPYYFLDENTPPILTYLGTKTIPSLYYYNDLFHQKLLEFQPQAKLITLNKKHVPMVTQFFWPLSTRFKEIKEFTEGIK